MPGSALKVCVGVGGGGWSTVDLVIHFGLALAQSWPSRTKGDPFPQTWIIIHLFVNTAQLRFAQLCPACSVSPAHTPYMSHLSEPPYWLHNPQILQQRLFRTGELWPPGHILYRFKDRGGCWESLKSHGVLRETK